MAICEVCGNDYDQTMEIRQPDGDVHTFDSFECAIHQLAPRCAHCGCRIVGHGHEVGDRHYCCAHCARAHGHQAVADRVG